MDNLTINELEYTPTATIAYYTYTRMYGEEERLFESSSVIPLYKADEVLVAQLILEKLATEIF